MANPLLTDEQRRRLENQNSTYNQIMQGFEAAEQQNKQEDEGWLSGLARGAKAGFGGLGAGLLHAGQAAFGTDGSMANSLDAMAEANAQHRDWSLADTFSLDYLTNPDGLAYGLGQIAGSMALPAAFGAGIAAAVPTGGTSLLGTGALIGAAGAAPMAISEGGNTYAQGLKDGMSEEEAKKAGLIDAGIKLPFYMLSEGLSGKVAQGLITKGLLNAEGKSLGRRAAEGSAKIFGNALNEAYEEGTENRSSAYALGDPRISSFANIFNPFDWNDEDKAQGVGVFTPTLALGAFTGGAGHLRNRFKKNNDVSAEIASEDGGTIEETEREENFWENKDRAKHSIQQAYADGLISKDDARVMLMKLNDEELGEADKKRLVEREKQVAAAIESRRIQGYDDELDNYVNTRESEKEAFINAIAGQESGGNYEAENGRTGAYGKYQIMPENWPAWAEEAGIGADAPRTPENQEIVARFKLGQYYDKYGARGAAIAWYGGEGALNYSEEALNRKQGNGNEPSINEYADEVLGRMGNYTPDDARIDDSETNYFDESNSMDDTNLIAPARAKGFDVSHLADEVAQDNRELFGEKQDENIGKQNLGNDFFANISKAQQAEKSRRAQAVADIANASVQQRVFNELNNGIQSSYLEQLRNAGAVVSVNNNAVSPRMYKMGHGALTMQNGRNGGLNANELSIMQQYQGNPAAFNRKYKQAVEPVQNAVKNGSITPDVGRAYMQNLANMYNTVIGTVENNGVILQGQDPAIMKTVARLRAKRKQGEVGTEPGLLQENGSMSRNAPANMMVNTVAGWDRAEAEYEARAKEKTEKQRQAQAIADIVNARAAKKWDAAEKLRQQIRYNPAMRKALAAQNNIHPDTLPSVQPTPVNKRAIEGRNFVDRTLAQARANYENGKRTPVFIAGSKRKMPTASVKARNFSEQYANDKTKREMLRDAAETVWTNDPKHPMRECRKNLNDMRHLRKEILQPIVNFMSKGMGQGVSLVPQESKYWNGTADDERKMVRASNNAPWYSRYYKENHKQPTKTNMYNIAEDIFFGKDEYGVGYYSDIQDEAIEQVIADNHEQLDFVNGMIEAFETLELKLKENPNYGKEWAKGETAAKTRTVQATSDSKTDETRTEQVTESDKDEVNKKAPALAENVKKTLLPKGVTAEVSVVGDRFKNIQVKFNGKPGKEVSGIMGRAGYKWNQESQTWKARADNEQAMEIAEQLGYKPAKEASGMEKAESVEELQKQREEAGKKLDEARQDYKANKPGVTHDDIENLLKEYNDVSKKLRTAKQNKTTEPAKATKEVNNAQEHKYYLNSRPADIGAVPEGFTRVDGNDKGGRYGAIYYDRALSDKEVKQYELKSAADVEKENAQKKAIEKVSQELLMSDKVKAQAKNNSISDFMLAYRDEVDNYLAEHVDDDPTYAELLNRPEVTDKILESESVIQNTYNKLKEESAANSSNEKTVDKVQRFDKERANKTLANIFGKKNKVKEPKPNDVGKKFVNVFDESKLDELVESIKKKLNRLNANPIFDPELMSEIFQVGGIYLQQGINKFANWSNIMVGTLGEKVRPFLTSAWNSLNKFPSEQELNAQAMQAVMERVGGDFDEGKSLQQIKKDLVEEFGDEVAGYVDAAYEGVKAYPTSNTAENVVESNQDNNKGGSQNDSNITPELSGNDTGFGKTSNEIRETSTSEESSGSNGQGSGTLEGQGRHNGNNGVPGSRTAAGGKTSVRKGSEQTSTVGKDSTRGAELSGSVVDSLQEQPNVNERAAENIAESVADGRADAADTVSQKVNEVVKENNLDKRRADRLRKTAKVMPFLSEIQLSNTDFVAERFDTNGKQGVMITDGTGTGKTFSGLAVAKEMADEGKGNTLIVTPSDSIANQWIAAAEDFFNLNVAKLEDTKDAGKGAVITTYANLGANEELVKRDWDLVVCDEAHNLMNNEAGEKTAALSKVRLLTLHPSELRSRAEQTILPEKKLEARKIVRQAGRLKWRKGDLTAKEQAIVNQANKLQEDGADKLTKEEVEQIEAQVKDWQELNEAEKPKVMFLSATPFAYVKDIDYANGYLFDYPKVEGGSYNQAHNGFEQFMMEHFGYRLRYNKLTSPDSTVDNSLMEVEFHEWLRSTGALTGHELEIDKDYNRGFLLVNQGVGKKIDEGFDFLRQNDKKYGNLEKVLNQQFDARRRNYLLESIKARESVPIIKEYLKSGKKVVVFYETNVARESFNPFKFTQDTKEMLRAGGEDSKQTLHEWDLFAKERPDLVNLNLDELAEPISIYSEAFGDEAMFFNGRVSKKKRAEYVKNFNDDDSGKNLIFVQQDAGNAGISLHDTTGKYQRVLINIGIPRRPSYAIQIEGRIYRLGNKSNAIIRYLTTATNIENGLFANTIAGRASTAENLALGRKARGLRDSFKNAYQEVLDGTWEDRMPGAEGEDVGGKEYDRSVVATSSDYDRAKGLYFARGKRTSKNKSAEGVDYFATPEPIGYKMVQWAGLKDGDKVLEPSAGHGAISRFFSPNTDNTIIEPSGKLAPQAQMNTDNAKLINGYFEDHHITNKYDAVVMNPPFGTGGKTAIEHLAKAYKHLRDGGRVIALIPRGPMADKRFNKWYESDDAKGARMVGEVLLPNVTFERAGTKVATRIVVLDKGGEDLGYQRNIDLSNIDNINELFDWLENADMPERQVKTNVADVRAAIGEFADKMDSNKNDESANGIVSPDMYKHTKTGELIPFARINKSLSNEEYSKIKELAKKNDGYYSKFAKGFLFKDEEGRNKFIEEANSDAQYSVSDEATTRTREEVEAEIKKALPGAELEQQADGSYIATMANGKKLGVVIEDQILLNEKQAADAAKAHNRTASEAEGYWNSWERLEGKNVDGVLRVSRNSRVGTAFHETLHAAMDLCLNGKEKAALYKAFAKRAKESGRSIDEEIADGYKDWVIKRQQGKGSTFGKLFQKAKDFLNKLYTMFVETNNKGNIFRKLESGEAWKQQGEKSSNASYSVNASTESINPNEDYIQGINDTDPKKVSTLADSFEKKGYIGRPIVLIENGNEGYVAVTGSHRIEAAKQADVDLKAIVLDNNDETTELIEARDDDERVAVAKRLYDNGVISKNVYNIIREENENNYAHYSVALSQHKIASAFTNTERKGTIETAKEFFKEKKKNWYTELVDKNHILKSFDALTKATGGLSVYDQVQNLPSTTAGMLKAICEGNALSIKAANQHLKNVKMKHNVTLAMALAQIDKKTMDKAQPKYLAANGFDSWVNAFGAYLGAERLLEMNDLAKADGKVYKFPKGLTEAELRAFTRNVPSQFRKAADIFYKVNDNMISVMEDAQVFSHELAQVLRTKYKKYCPLLRDFSDTAAADTFINGLTEGGRGIGNVSIPLKKINIEGSERGVLNPLETILKSYSVMLNRAERNKVGLMAVDAAKTAQLHDLIKEVPEKKDVKGNVVNAVADPKNCIFTVLVNGKKKAYQTTQELYSPIVGYNLPAAGLCINVARMAAHMLRTGATMSPSFIVRNFLRDTVFAGISSKNGFIPFVDSIRGALALWNDPAMRAEFEAAGVTEYNFYGSQNARIKSIDAMAGAKPVGALEMIKWAFTHLEAASDFVESSTRMGEFMKARKKGLSMEEAARAAREVTLDFSRSGVTGEQINRYVPFFNACIQGGDKMVRLFREDMWGTSMKVFEYIVLPSMILYAFNYDQDWWKDLDPDIKNNNWCLGEHLRIPKPQEAGVLFGSGIEALFDQAQGKDKEAVVNWLKAFKANMTPGIVPTLFLPLLEWQANYSYFQGRQLVGSKYQRLPDELQYNDYTSELSKMIGNNPLYKLSPMKIDNLVRGYTGTMGAFIWSAPDALIGNAKNLPEKKLYERYPFRDFTVTDANQSRPMNNFYDILDKANKQHAGYGVKGKPEAAVKGIRSAGSAISKIRKDVDKITHSNLTPERKRELIDKRKEKMNQIARKATERYGKYFD